MKPFIEYIAESKFTNFNSEELKKFKDILKTIEDNYSAIKVIYPFKTLKKEDIKLGHVYYIEFDNPFADSHKWSKVSGKEEAPETVETIKCIAIGDKFGRLFLQNQWEYNSKITLEYKGGYSFTNKEYGNKVNMPASWVINRPDFSAYKVTGYYDPAKKGPVFYHNTGELIKIFNVKVNNNIKYFDIENINKYINDGNIALSKQEATRKLKEIKDAEWRKFNDYMNKVYTEYKYLGAMNGWKETPEIFKIANDDPENTWKRINDGRGYDKYISDKYKIYYSADSSD